MGRGYLTGRFSGVHDWPVLGVHRGEWVAEAFRQHQVEYQAIPLDRSALYLELLSVVNAGMVASSISRRSSENCVGSNVGVGCLGEIGSSPILGTTTTWP